MATANIVLIPPYTARGLNFLANGQQVTASLPAGEYDVLPEAEVAYTDLGVRKVGKAVPVVNIATGAKWYVSPNVAAFLEREHKRP